MLQEYLAEQAKPQDIINKNWHNLRYSAPNVMKGAQASVDLSKVNEFKCVNGVSCVDFNNREENVTAFEDVSFMTAKSAELNSWKSNKVYRCMLKKKDWSKVYIHEVDMQPQRNP